MTTDAPAPRMRRQRSATESLTAVALALEAILVFFVALTAFGLKSLPAEFALGGGLAGIVVLAVLGRLVRFGWGQWLGWVAQLALIAVGFVLPIMFVIGAGFAAIYAYCFVKGRQLDTANSIPQEKS